MQLAEKQILSEVKLLNKYKKLTLKISKNITLIIFFMLFVIKAYTQDTIPNVKCGKNITTPFVSDGQQYIAKISGEQKAEFRMTFYKGATYRIETCFSNDETEVIFSLFDQEKNLLFSNEKYGNAKYWDFQFDSTIECLIETGLPKGSRESGYVKLNIGFKQQTKVNQ